VPYGPITPSVVSYKYFHLLSREKDYSLYVLMSPKMNGRKTGRTRGHILSGVLAQRFNLFSKREKETSQSGSTIPDDPEPIAKPRSGSLVLELNNDNFRDVIADSNKDVVVEFYGEEVLPIMDPI
jgi:hypothetical protein